jgi:Anti-sigma-K factor rskA
MSSRDLDFDCPRSIDAAPYVLGALEDEDGFREHLASCQVCSAEVAELQPVIDKLPSTVPPTLAPAPVRDRVLATARAEAELLRAAGQEADEPPRERRFSARRISFGAALGAVAASAAVAVAIALSVSSSSPRVRVNSASVSLPGAHAILRQVDGRAELVVSGMPQPPHGKIYQVWLSRGSGSPRPTDALFGVTSRGTGSVNVPGTRGASEVLVTSEPQGGSLHPTSEPVIRVALAT